MKIDTDGYRHWYNHVYKDSNGDFENGVSPAMSLKRHLIENIENVLTMEMQRSPLHESANGSLAKKHHSKGNRAPMTKVEIADVVFSFHNQDLILALRKRG